MGDGGAGAGGAPSAGGPRFKAVVLLGAPGAGKGTQGELISRVPGFHHMSTGDMFRTLDRESELGREIVRYMHAGELVPDELTVRLWEANVRARSVLGMYRPGRDLLILDGIPRNAAQAGLVGGVVDVLAVVHLVLSDEEAMVQRLKQRAMKQGRQDDAKEEVIRRRFEVYRADTAPLLSHYQQGAGATGGGAVHEVDAMDVPGTVLSRVLAVLAPLQAAEFGNPLA